MKRGGGRRFYRPADVDLLKGIRHLLYGQGYTIRGVQRILKEQGTAHVVDDRARHRSCDESPRSRPMSRGRSPSLRGSRASSPAAINRRMSARHAMRSPTSR